MFSAIRSKISNENRQTINFHLKLQILKILISVAVSTNGRFLLNASTTTRKELPDSLTLFVTDKKIGDFEKTLNFEKFWTKFSWVLNHNLRHIYNKDIKL